MSGLSIRAHDLRKEFQLHGGAVKTAVGGVSFNLGEGERLGLIGANGAGKSTLLHLLTGVAEPTAGSLDIQGKVTAILTLGIGLRDDLTGRDNIFVEGELQGRSREQTAMLVDEIVDFAELREFIDRPVRTYSTGMKARLAFSTITHIEPEILVIDEALSVGDVRFGAKAARKMRELTQKGRILILVSHSMGSINDMCTRCIWLDDGKVRMDGPPVDVTAAYLEEVRGADNASSLARFRRELVHEQLVAGWDITGLGMRTGEGLEASLLVTGQPALLRARIAGAAEATFEARLRIDRLDGLAVLDRRSPAGVLRVDERGEGEVKVDFGPLPLNFGIYRALLEAAHEGRVVARRSVLFEVINPRPPRGGRPVLVYPTSVRVTELSR